MYIFANNLFCREIDKAFLKGVYALLKISLKTQKGACLEA
jgi:hypothetical protein